jgi:superfamily II DNA/RNA helicase
MAHFDQFKLLPPIQQALTAIGFKVPTPIQQKAIPSALSGSDLVGNAQTGTGKTAAFCIPLLTTLLNEPKKTGLILVPTRELSLQIEKFWAELTQFCKEVNAVSLVGGIPMETQTKKLAKNPRLIVATPGRLVDHLQQENLSLKTVGVLVLDEADRMLDMGFAPQLDEIVSHVPKKRQTLFFTATWDSDTNALSKKFLQHNSERIRVGETSQAASTVTQTLLNTTQDGKRDLLLEEINSHRGSILVFAGTQQKVEHVTEYLESYEVPVNCLHGGRSQGQRKTALREFREGKIRVLVATDVAARGIDVADVSHVVNYDLPQIAEDYVHRIGRTGRAGATGTATSFLAPEDQRRWTEIETLLKETGSAVPKAKVPKQTRAANAEDLNPDLITVQVSKKPTRGNPQNRRENQWHKGTVVVKPEHEQRIKSKTASTAPKGKFGSKR